MDPCLFLLSVVDHSLWSALHFEELQVNFDVLPVNCVDSKSELTWVIR